MHIIGQWSKVNGVSLNMTAKNSFSFTIRRARKTGEQEWSVQLCDGGGGNSEKKQYNDPK